MMTLNCDNYTSENKFYKTNILVYTLHVNENIMTKGQCLVRKYSLTYNHKPHLDQAK